MGDRKITDEQRALMLWKLAPGDANRVLNGEDSIPTKDRVATASSWHIDVMKDADIRTVNMGVPVSNDVMELLEKGHIPQVQEDHWFMYCADGVMRWYRSWTGYQVFAARYYKTEDGFVISDMDVTINLGDVPVSGPQSAGNLFMMLCMAEAGGNFWPMWGEYLKNLENGE